MLDSPEQRRQPHSLPPKNLESGALPLLGLLLDQAWLYH